MESWSPKISAAFEGFRAKEGIDFHHGLPSFKLDCSLSQLACSTLFFAVMLLVLVLLVVVLSLLPMLPARLLLVMLLSMLPMLVMLSP